MESPLEANQFLNCSAMQIWSASAAQNICHFYETKNGISSEWITIGSSYFQELSKL